MLVCSKFLWAWFLKSYLGSKSTANYLAAFKTSLALHESYPKLSTALTTSMQRHSWYLTEQLVIFALSDDDVDEEEKRNLLESLLEQEVPVKCSSGKPDLPIITATTALSDLVGPQSWVLLALRNKMFRDG